METNVICSRSGSYSSNLKILTLCFPVWWIWNVLFVHLLPFLPMWSLAGFKCFHGKAFPNRLLWFQLYPSFTDVMAVRLNFWHRRWEDVSPCSDSLLAHRQASEGPLWRSDPRHGHSVSQTSVLCASPDPSPLASHPMPYTQSHEKLHLTLKMPLYILPMDRSILPPVLPVHCFLLF